MMRRFYKSVILNIAAVLLVTCCLPFQAYAASEYADGLLDGLPISIYDLRDEISVGSTTKLTDGDVSTYEEITTKRIYYTFTAPVTISEIKMRYKVANTGTQLALFTMLDGSNVFELHGYYGGTTETDVTIPINKKLKKFYIICTNGWPWQIYELNAFGERVPNKPYDLTAAASSGKVVLNWTDGGYTTGFNVYRDGAKINAAPIIGTSYTATGLSDNRSYSWQVSGLSGSQETQLTSPITSFFDSIPPSKPKGLLATPLTSGGKVHLQWIANDVAEGVKGYRIFKDGASVLSVTQPAGVVSAEPEINHQYTVKAYDEAGNESPASDPLTAAALIYPDLIPPAAPTNLVANGLVGKVQLSWKANTEEDLDGYIIYRNGLPINGTPIKANTFEVVGGMTWGTVYKFMVAAVDKSKNVSAPSNEAKAAATMPSDTQAPEKPTGLTASISSDAMGILLDWNANEDQDLQGYILYVSTDNLTWEKVIPSVIGEPHYKFPYSTGLKQYYFRVTAVDDAGNESKPSASVGIRTPSREPSETENPTEPSLIVSWDAIAGAVGYLVYFNDNLVANVSSNVLQYEIKASQGYDPDSNNRKVVVLARFIDGSTGTDSNSSDSSKWGFNIKDIWSSSLYVIGSLAAFILLGICIAITPRIIRLVRRSIEQRRSMT